MRLTPGAPLGARDARKSERGFSMKIALVGAAVVVAGVAGAGLLFRGWIAPRTLELLPSLARVGEPEEIAELMTAEYYGEVIVTLAELVDSVGAPENIAAYHARLRTVAESDTSALEFQLVRRVTRNGDADLLDRMRARPWSELEGDYTRRWRLARVLVTGVEVAYLARGRVRVAFDVDRLWAEGECEGGEGGRIPLDACPLARDTLTVHVPDGVRDLEGIVNPFFDFERRIPGYVVLAERWPERAGDYLPLVRQLARCKLERKSVERGLLQLADASLEQGLEGLLLALGRQVAVRVETPPGDPSFICTRPVSETPRPVGG